MRRPLDGIRIVDFGWIFAAPYGTHLLASLGAEVIKIEAHEPFEHTRMDPPFAGRVPGPDRSGLYATFNGGKRSCTLSLDDPDQMAVVKALVNVSDIVVESFSYGIMESRGLSYETLSRVRPDIIMIACSGFGRTGPLKAMRAYMNNIAGIIGLSSLNGYHNGPPRAPGSAWADFTAGTGLAFAAMVALHHRNRTGRGQYIDLSMAELNLTLLGPAIGEYFATGQTPARRGNYDDTALPQNVYPCKGDDRWVAISVTTDVEWRALCTAMGNPAWSRDLRFRDAAGRLKHRAEIDAYIGRWSRQHDASDLVAVLQRHGVPATVCANAQDLFNDPQLRYRRFFASPSHPQLGRRRHPKPPCHVTRPASVRYTRPPLLGEHNGYIVQELLGMPGDLAKRMDQGTREVVRQHFPT